MLSTADVGSQVRVVITATNVAASVAVASASSASVEAAPPTPAAVNALLLKEIVPNGTAGSISALLKAGGDTITFTALSAGSALVDWYYVPAGAHIAKAKRKAQLVASGRMTFGAAGTGKLKIRLTAAGKKLLKRERNGHGTLLKLTAKGTFTPNGAGSVSATKTFTPQR